MPWVDMLDLLNHAYRNRYAVGSFGAANLDCIEAVLAAAEHARSPVILNLSESRPGHSAFELVAAAAERAAQRATVPVALQFEGGGTPESTVRAINFGCNGVRVAAAHESFPANVANTRRIAEMAHACGVMVEGELGRAGDGEASQDAYTVVEEAKAFVQRTGVDCLSVSIGFANGRSRGRLKLDVDRLRRINEAVRIPLAIYADSGFTDEQCHKLMQHGIARVSVDTLTEAIVGGCLRTGARKDSRAGFGVLAQDVRVAVRAEAERCLHRWGSAGRAAEVQVQCRVWQPVQHVIVYNVDDAGDEQVDAMMARGRDILSRIPGVRRVFTGWAVQQSSRYRCCWLIEFAHEKVINNYQQHPDHVEFANQLFRPLAGDRISIDFVETSSAVAEKKKVASHVRGNR